MAAAIALTKTLTATATLGRISSAYPDGRQYKGAWGNSTRIVYPRPTSERNAGGTFDGGLHGEYDKWLAGVPWYPCLGVMHGAFPYRVQISSETVDGSPADTGVQFAEYIEDHTATTPYLGFYHAGFTAPAAGTKVIAFLITVTDCLGTTDTYPVSLTVYAQDHASVLDHFRVVDTTAGTNGTGHWSSPINTISGADVNSNKTLYGTSWASTTHCPKTVIALYKTGSTIQPTGMTNMPGSDVATVNEILSGYFPRSHIGVYGATVTIDFTSNPHTFNTQAGGQVNDILIKNIKFQNNPTVGRIGVNFGVAQRCHIQDVAFDTFGTGATGSNEAPIRTSGVGANNYDCTILRSTFNKPYSITANGGNHYGAISVISWHLGLIDDIAITNMDHNVTFRNDGMVRIKHDSVDSEFRRITAIATVQVVQGSLTRIATGGGIGATADKHTRFLQRHCNLRAISANAFQCAVSATANEEHSAQLHFNTMVGGLPVDADATTTIENAHEFLGYKNLIENPASGFSLTNMTPINGEAGTTSGNVGGTLGTLLDTAGLPLDSQYLGAVGHTVITV